MSKQIEGLITQRLTYQEKIAEERALKAQIPMYQGILGPMDDHPHGAIGEIILYYQEQIKVINEKIGALI